MRPSAACQAPSPPADWVAPSREPHHRLLRGQARRRTGHWEYVTYREGMAAIQIMGTPTPGMVVGHKHRFTMDVADLDAARGDLH